MRVADLAPDLPVYVTRGYSRRAAVVVAVADGRVAVRFVDAAATSGVRLPDGHAGGLYGATVLPRAVEARP